MGALICMLGNIFALLSRVGMLLITYNWCHLIFVPCPYQINNTLISRERLWHGGLVADLYLL